MLIICCRYSHLKTLLYRLIPEARRAPKRRNEFESSREHDRYMKGFEPLPPNQKYAKNVNDEYDPYHPSYLPEPPPPPGYDHDFWRSRRAGYGPEEGEILNSSFDSTGGSLFNSIQYRACVHKAAVFTWGVAIFSRPRAWLKPLVLSWYSSAVYCRRCCASVGRC